MEQIEVNIPEDMLYALIKMAHQRGLLLNQLILELLHEQLAEKNFQKHITTIELQENLDSILEDVAAGVIYFVRPTVEEEATMVLMSYEDYDRMKNELRM